MRALDHIIAKEKAKHPSYQAPSLKADKVYRAVLEEGLNTWFKLVFREDGQLKSVAFSFHHLLTVEFIDGPEGQEQLLIVGAGLSFKLTGTNLESIQAGLLNFKVTEIREYQNEEKKEGKALISEIKRFVGKIEAGSD